MRKRYLLGLCLAGALVLTGCGNQKKLMTAEDAKKETVKTEQTDSGNTEETEETTEAQKNVTKVVEKNVSEKLSSSSGDVTVAVEGLDGYSRNFGSASLIQYLSTGSVFTDISYQLYEGYKPEQITKLAETYANSADYGNKMKDKLEEFSYEDYSGVTLSFENNGKNVYEMVLMKEVNANCILAITILQDNKELNNDAVAKLVTSAVSVAASKEESSEETTDEVSTEVSTENSESDGE